MCISCSWLLPGVVVTPDAEPAPPPPAVLTQDAFVIFLIKAAQKCHNRTSARTPRINSPRIQSEQQYDEYTRTPTHNTQLAPSVVDESPNKQTQLFLCSVACILSTDLAARCVCMPRNKFYADIPHEIHNMSRVAEADAKRKRQVVVQAAFECACRAVIILRFSVSSTHATKQEFHVGCQHHRGTYLPYRRW